MLYYKGELIKPQPINQKSKDKLKQRKNFFINFIDDKLHLASKKCFFFVILILRKVLLYMFNIQLILMEKIF